MNNKTRHLAAACSALTCLIAAPATVAGAATTPPATTPPPSVPVVPAPPAVPSGAIKLVMQKVGGQPKFAIVGSRIVVRGIVLPYVAGQSVKVSFYRGGRKVAVKTVSVLDNGNGAGQFHVGYSGPDAGLIQARAVHYATPQQALFKGRSASVHYVNVNLGPGSSGESVRLLQSELAALHYAVPLSGSFDEGTGRALIAYRKVAGLNRIAYSGREVFKKLQRHAGSFHVRYVHDGRHVEGDLTKQVLAEIDAGGRVHAIYEMSSGKPSTPTVIGRFNVYSKTLGTNEKGMVDSNYFIRGYAIHGYAEVPTYAASHGCLRVPVPDAPTIYGWVRLGTPVDVYYEGGGGSSRVRSNAGP